MTSTYERLRDSILSNGVEVRGPLTETTLGETLGVSRTPIREALKRLEQDGLVERYGRGVRIKERSPEEILEIYEVRIALEGSAARGAANRRTELDIYRLEATHEEMQKLPPEADLTVKVELNDRFHTELWAASHNSTLTDVITRLMRHLQRYPQSTLAFPGRWELILGEHEELLAAIRNRDDDRAGELAAEHMRIAREARLKMFAQENAARQA